MQNPLSSRPHPSSPKFPTTASTPSNPQAPTSSFDKPTKKKISKGSQLFSEIQSLTNKIKMIDKSQDKLIQERIQRTYSREGSVTSKKLDDSTNVHSLTDLPPKASTKHPDVLVPCEGCKRKEEQTQGLISKIRQLEKKVENEHKQIVYLNFQQELLREAAGKSSGGDRGKETIELAKLSFRKALEGFMADVVVAKLGEINGWISGLSIKVEKLAQGSTPSVPTLQPRKSNQIKADANMIKMEGEMLMPSSSIIDLRKRSLNKNQADTNLPKSSKVKTLEATLSEKVNKIRELQTQLQAFKAKQLEEKLLVSQKEYRKLNERHLVLQKKQEDFQVKLEECSLQMAMVDSDKSRYETLEKEITLKNKEVESISNQLKDEKEVHKADVVIINRLKERIQQLDFEILGLKHEPQQTSGSSDTQLKTINFEKQFKLFEDSSTKLKGEIKRLNQTLGSKSKELQLIHEQYRRQLFEKEKKLYQLEQILKEDFSKIRDSADSDYQDCRASRDSENSLMFSTTKIMGMSKEIEFFLTEGDITLADMPTIEELFHTKDFGRVNFSCQEEQQEFLRKVGEYIDVIKVGGNKRASKSKSRSSSEDRHKEERKGGDLKMLIQSVLIEVNRITREAPTAKKEEFQRLKELLEKLTNHLSHLQSSVQLLTELKQLSLSLCKLVSKDRSKQVEELSRNIKHLLRPTPE